MKQHPTVLAGDVQSGVKDALPVALGYIPAALAYGLLAKNAGLGLPLTLALSLFVYAGASQFAAVTMLVAGQGVLSIVALTFILNLRHVLMSTALAARLSERNPLKRALIAFGVTDETFSVASLGSSALSTPYLLSLNATAYTSWFLGSLLGHGVGGILPATLQSSMGIALYAMFIGLLIPSVRRSRTGLMIALLAMGMNTVGHLFLSPGVAIVIVAVVVAGGAALILPAPGLTQESAKGEVV